MTGLVEAVAAKLRKNKLGKSCMVSGRLRKQGCGVSLKDAPEPRLIVDFDKPGSPLGQSETRCDYLFVANGGRCADWIAPLELKRGSLHAGDVVRQLRAGATAAEGLVSRNKKVRFRPTAVYGSIHPAEIKRLRADNNKVEFHGHVVAIRLIKCGAPLTDALWS